jgi:hypothetical protein
MLRKFIPLVLLSTLLAYMLVLQSARAGDRIVSINSGDASTRWVINGEPSLVMNGFDLSSLQVGLPAIIDRVSINVRTPVPGTPIDVVVYQDANSGSPVDATLVARTTVDIASSGLFTVVFPSPVTVTQSAVWVGFYLPVNFEFLADASGSSVLTYWAWTPNATFDVASLSNAAVLGPVDGSAPVNINMGGKARISIELVTGGVPQTPLATLLSPQTSAGVADASVLAEFQTCAGALYDTADERITYRDSIDVRCNIVESWRGPASPSGYVQRGTLYDITYYRENGNVLSARLDFPVTHCIRPNASDLNSAVMGVAFGLPRAWRLLPTQRVGDLVCADMRRGGNISYFIPGIATATPTPLPS